MAKEKKEEKKLNYEETIAALNKEYGLNTIVNFETEASVYEVIPTGNISIDYKVLGIGGVAKKKFYMIKGWSGSNKSTFCGHVSANCQSLGGKVLYIDTESAVDISYFNELGVKFGKNFLLCQPSNGEEGVKVALDLIKTGEIDLVIIDSDSMLVPKSITDAEPGTQNIGKKAKFNSDNYPRLKKAIVEHNVCLIGIFQYRVDPGKMFGDNRTIPGGFAAEYIADVIIDLTRRFNKEGDETLGTNTTIKTTKNKTFIPYKEATSQVAPMAPKISRESAFMRLIMDNDVIAELRSRIFAETCPSAIDPDLMILKSLSPMAKLAYQRQREGEKKLKELTKSELNLPRQWSFAGAWLEERVSKMMWG